MLCRLLVERQRILLLLGAFAAAKSTTATSCYLAASPRMFLKPAACRKEGLYAVSRTLVLPSALLGLQRRPEVAQRTAWAGGLPFKLCDVSFKGRLEFHCKRSIFLEMGVQLDQSQSQPRVFKQLNCRTVAHARMIAFARNDLLILPNPSQLYFDERKATRRTLCRP
jgi:hypothetical protein